jgi:hypothetical protein
MTMRSIYFIISAVIFVIEIAIGVGIIGGSFVRGSLGDILAIALVYCLLRAAPRFSPIVAAISAVVTGFLIEALQYIKMAELLGLKAGSILYIMIGNTFTLSDLLIYTLGGFLSLSVDRYILIPSFKLKDHRLK